MKSQKPIKLSEKQLSKLQTIQSELQKAQSEIGGIEIQIAMMKDRKLSMLRSVADGQDKMQSILDDIKEEFGSGSIDINTGDFVPSVGQELSQE